MAKIMLVEDDNNLREIYEARLLAEGYEIVSARDGEEALALAVKEKPDLIISDVMMPKISGFDMLDILRSTPETKNTKVVMMTALSQADDKNRAERLGADRYLVKSQVTLEDVARVAREVLDGSGGQPPTATSHGIVAASGPQTTTLVPTPPGTPSPDPVPTPTPTPVPNDPPDDTKPEKQTSSHAAGVDASLAEPTATEEKEIHDQIKAFVNKQPVSGFSPTGESPVPVDKPSDVADGMAQPESAAKQIAVVEEAKNGNGSPVTTITPTEPKKEDPYEKETLADAPTPGGPERKPEEGDDVPIAHKKIIQPIGDPLKKTDLDALLAKEEAATDTENPDVDSVISPAGQVSQSPDAPVDDRPSPDSSLIKPTDPNTIAL